MAMDYKRHLTGMGFRMMMLVMLLFPLGCVKKPAAKTDPALRGNMTYDRAQVLLHDKSLPKGENPKLARALQDFYMGRGCVGVGFGESPETATSQAEIAYRAHKCQKGEPAKTIRFTAHNGTFYCIMTTNVLADEIKLEK